MADKVNNSIRGNYKRYIELLIGHKDVLTSPIVVDEVRGNHKNIIWKSVLVAHESIIDELELHVEAKIDNSSDFKFKLRCPKFDNRFLFRYDSDGPPHRNSALDIPLAEQQVTTPHFHKYTSDGYEIAYKSDILLDEMQATALNDISLCICHFCRESNTNYDGDKFPEITIHNSKIPFTFEDTMDPLQNIDFKL
jgi:hypothetical protein